MTWTNHRIEQAKTMWLDGQSAAQIAKALKDVTRSAVIGKMRRLGIDSPSTPSVRAAAQAVTRRATKRPPIIFANPGTVLNPEAAPPTPIAPAVQTITQRPWLTRKPGECARPTAGEGADTLSCCAPTGDITRQYCEPCRALMWKPTAKKVRVTRREADQGLAHVPINRWAA